MSNYIPLEIQLEIMKTLPIKSLIRFRSVCKTWKSLIDSYEFIIDYHNLHGRTHSQTRNLLVQYVEDRVEKYVSINIDNDDDDTFPQHKFSLTYPKSFIHRKILIGSSQGLVCLFPDYLGKYVVLWNPTIRKSVVIDVPPDAPNVLEHPCHETIIGFGVCPRTSDPKLVKITCIDDEFGNTFWEQVEVFTLSKGVWRNPLCSNIPRESISLTWSQVAIERFIYWRAFVSGESQLYNLIMSFDMTSEEFTQICLPDSLANSDYIRLSLFELMESLVVLENDYTEKEQVWNVWMMLTNGVPNSFTKLYTIKTPYASIRGVLGFKKSGEPIIITRKDSEDHDAIFVYEPHSEHITYIGISGKQYSFFGSSYIETLLLLDQRRL